VDLKKDTEDDDWDLSEKSVKTGNKYLDKDLNKKAKVDAFFDNKDYDNILDSIPTL
jgi:hypothetical protein